ncbi:Uridylate kinase [Heracleum sosnowskyi]|uniref:UMP kinase n=1 Tax=Heracleum sosnowskyi TaxID=360622 RepID=A0AAD8N861_9APIA|nr:Uridylate kinase [Heracleum sosnowskyi]
MSSRDDDFSLLNTTSTNSNPKFNHHRSSTYLFSSHAPPSHAPPPPFLQPILNSPVDNSPKEFSGEEDDGDAEEYSDGGAFCSQPDPKSYHGGIPLSNDNDAILIENDSRSRINLSNEKRNDVEDLSDGETMSYSYKRAKVSAGGSGEFRKDREEWNDVAIVSLIEAYTEKFIVQLNRGNLRGRDWEEVTKKLNERCDKQSKTTEQCKNKVDNLKKRYKLERQRMSKSGVSVTHWPWFKKMEMIVGNVSDEEKSVGGSASSLKQSKSRYGTATSSPSGQITNMNTKPVIKPKWRRVVFKISGAALAGSGSHSIDPEVAMLIAREVSVACSLGVEVAIVVGGRNFFCGDTWVTATGDRCTAYQIGMMATVMNSILLQSAMEKMGVQTRVQTAFAMPEVAEPYSRQRAIRHLEKGRVVIFGGIGAGTGNPLFSTDTAAALRASEIHADAVLKGTMVNNTDGVCEFESKSKNNLFEHVSFREMASRGSSAMDMMAVTFCEENNFPVVIFNLLEPGNISRALSGEQVGTLVDQTGQINTLALPDSN